MKIIESFLLVKFSFFYYTVGFKFAMSILRWRNRLNIHKIFVSPQIKANIDLLLGRYAIYM